MSTQIDSIATDDYNPPKRPSGLNVLSILSIIWSIVQIISSVWGFISAKKNFDEKDKVLDQLKNPDMPKWAKGMIGDPDKFLITVTKSYENRLPIMILGIVAAALCLYGVIQMRKLKKDGFLFYTIGELLPFATMALFIGTFALSGVMFIIFLVLALGFIALYASYRKNMVL